jgi:uncharacterized protein (DUF1684 family)
MRSVAVLALSSLAACSPGREAAAPDSPQASQAAQAAPAEKVPLETGGIPWEDEVAAWKQYRDGRLRQPDGWLTLIGFAWLDEGENSVGSAPGSRVRLPEGKAPSRLGTLRLRSGKVTFEAAEGAAATSNGVPVTSLAMLSDRDEGGPTRIEHGPITLFVIERAGRPAVRVRDREAATLASFRGLDYYPLDRAWRIEGRFEPAAEVREIPVPNVLGFEERIPSPGHVVFTAGGREVRLLALDDTGDGRLFLVFGDPTNGRETYGGGRFLYTDAPVDGRVIVDFNRAYNPPCVFTPYATCPLPPRENRLPFPVPAGEKKYALEAPHPDSAPPAT